MSVQQQIPVPRAGWTLEKYVFAGAIAAAYLVVVFAIIYPFYMYLN